MTDQSNPPAPKCPYCDATCLTDHPYYTCGKLGSNHIYMLDLRSSLAELEIDPFGAILDADHLAHKKVLFAYSYNKKLTTVDGHQYNEPLTRELVDRVLKMKAFW